MLKFNVCPSVLPLSSTSFFASREEPADASSKPLWLNDGPWAQWGRTRLCFSIVSLTGLRQEPLVGEVREAGEVLAHFADEFLDGRDFLQKDGDVLLVASDLLLPAVDFPLDTIAGACNLSAGWIGSCFP